MLLFRLGDDNLILVHYHRDFEVENDKVVTKEDIRSWYRGEKIEQEKVYHIFPVSAYIHSGVSLSLHNTVPGDFHGGWDTSHVGAVLVAKSEAKSRAKAYQMAEGLLENWNMCLSGDVYYTVKETYNKEKEQLDQDLVSGNYGYKNALEALKEI